MSTSIFNLEFSAGDECYAVLTGLDRSKMAAQLDSEQMSEFANRFDELRRKVVDGSVTLERNEMFEGLNDHYILDTLINWLDVVIEEDVVDGGVSHPKAVVDEAVMALKRLRDGEKSVTMCKGATWEIQECAELVEQVEHDNLKAARSVFDRAKGQLPPNACWHGVEGHSGLT